VLVAAAPCGSLCRCSIPKPVSSGFSSKKNKRAQLNYTYSGVWCKQLLNVDKTSRQ
jgi:hypothetical protein